MRIADLLYTEEIDVIQHEKTQSIPDDRGIRQLTDLLARLKRGCHCVSQER